MICLEACKMRQQQVCNARAAAKLLLTVNSVTLTLTRNLVIVYLIVLMNNIVYCKDMLDM